METLLSSVLWAGVQFFQFLCFLYVLQVYKMWSIFGGVSLSFYYPYCCNFLIYGISTVVEKYEEMFKHVNLLNPGLWQMK